MSNENHQERQNDSENVPDFNESIESEQAPLLTEATGRQILQVLRDIMHVLSNIPSPPQVQQTNGTPTTNVQNTSNIIEHRCQKPRVTYNGKSYIVSNVNNEHIDNALFAFFHVSPEDVESARNDLMTHLMRVVRAFIVERLRQRDLSPRTPWIRIPQGIRSRAIDRFESKAEHVLRIHLSLCEGSWISHHCLHSRWNNLIGQERRRENGEATNEEARFRLTPSPPPEARP